MNLTLNQQVVHGASEVLVTTAGQMELPCDLVGVDPHRDIAVLKMRPQARKDADTAGVCCEVLSHSQTQLTSLFYCATSCKK